MDSRIIAGVASLILMGAGCGTAEETRPTAGAPPLNVAPETEISGPPGPEIVLGPVEGYNTLQWKVDGVIAVSSGTTIDPGDISTCVLRDDFIGQRKYIFKYERLSDGAIRTAKVVHLENENYQVEIRENSLKQLQWTIKDKNSSTACVLTPSGTIPYPSTVPDPLLSFVAEGATSAKFKEMNESADIKTLTLQGQMP